MWSKLSIAIYEHLDRILSHQTGKINLSTVVYIHRLLSEPWTPVFESHHIQLFCYEYLFLRIYLQHGLMDYVAWANGLSSSPTELSARGAIPLQRCDFIPLGDQSNSGQDQNVKCQLSWWNKVTRFDSQINQYELCATSTAIFATYELSIYFYTWCDKTSQWSQKPEGKLLAILHKMQ